MIIRTISPSSEGSLNLDYCYSTEKEDSISFQDSDFFTAFQESDLLRKTYDLIEIERADDNKTCELPTYKIRVPITNNKMQNTMLTALEESTIIEQREDKDIEYECISSNNSTSISATDYDTSGLSYNILYFTTASTNTSNYSSRDLLNRLDTDTDGSSKNLSNIFGKDRDLSNIFGTGQDDNFETPVDKSARSKKGSKRKPQDDVRVISKRQIDSIFNTNQQQPLKIEKIKSSYQGKEMGSKFSFVPKDSQNTDSTKKCNAIAEKSFDDDQGNNKTSTDEGDSNINNGRKATSKDQPETAAKPCGHEIQCEDIISGHKNQCEEIDFLSVSNISPSSGDSKNIELESKSSNTGEKVSNINNNKHAADALPATIERFDKKVNDDKNESNILLIKLHDDTCQNGAEKIELRSNKADSVVVLTDQKVDISLGSKRAPVVNQAKEKIVNSGENGGRLCGQSDETDEKKYTSQTIRSLKYIASEDHTFSQVLTNLSQGTSEEKLLTSGNGESSSSQVLTNLSFDNVKQKIYKTDQIFLANESVSLVDQIFLPDGSWTGSMNRSYIPMDENISLNVESSNIKSGRSLYENKLVHNKLPSKKDDLEIRQKLVGGISHKHWTGGKNDNNTYSIYHSNHSTNSFDTFESSMCLDETFRGERKYGSPFNKASGGSSFRQEQNKNGYDDDIFIRSTVEIMEWAKTAFDTTIDLLNVFNCMSKETHIAEDKMQDKSQKKEKHDGSDEKKQGIKEKVLKMIHQKHESKNDESDCKSSEGFLNVMHLKERLSFWTFHDLSMFGTDFVQKGECCGIGGSFSDLSSGQNTNEENFNKICREKCKHRNLPEAPVRENIFEMAYVPANNISLRKHVQSVKTNFRLKRPLCPGPAKSRRKIRSSSPLPFKGGLKKVSYKKKVKGNLQKIEEESDHSSFEEHINGKNLSAENKIGRRRISYYSPSRSWDKSKLGAPAEYLTKKVKKNLSPKKNWHLSSGSVSSLSLACGAMEKPSFPAMNVTKKHKFNIAIQKINEGKDLSSNQNDLNSSLFAAIGQKKGISNSRVRSYRKKAAVLRPMKITTSSHIQSDS